MSDATLEELKTKLETEEQVYGELLAKLDELSDNPPPYAQDEGLAALLETLNASDALAETNTEPGSGIRGSVHKWLRKLIEPELDATRRQLAGQRAFNSNLVQFLNRFAQSANQSAARQAEFGSVLVGFSQRIDRLADAKDRLYASLGNTRADLLLEAMDKRLEQVRLGLHRAQERLVALSTTTSLARAELGAVKANLAAPAEPSSRPTQTTDVLAAFEPAHYVAFEERFRGSSESIRDKLTRYVPYLENQAPVLELGCGRGELLSLLRDAGIEASGIDDNSDMVRACTEKGLKAHRANLVTFLQEQSKESVGAIVAAQVVEHLPPPVLRCVIDDTFRALKPGGRVIFETVNPKSVLALVESFYRDLTHEKPLHPETLQFLLQAGGFTDVELVFSSPVSERGRLLPITGTGEEAETLNENFRKLNAFLFGDQDYAVIGKK